MPVSVKKTVWKRCQQGWLASWAEIEIDSDMQFLP